MSEQPKVMALSVIRAGDGRKAALLTIWNGEEQKGVILATSPDVARTLSGVFATMADETAANPWLTARQFLIFTDPADVRRRAEAAIEAAGERFVDGPEPKPTPANETRGLHSPGEYGGPCGCGQLRHEIGVPRAVLEVLVASAEASLEAMASIGRTDMGESLVVSRVRPAVEAAAALLKGGA
jgi:hypothetical protein